MSCQAMLLSVFRFHRQRRGRVHFCISLLHIVVQQHCYLACLFSFVAISFQAMLLFIIFIGSGAGGFIFAFRCCISLCHNNYNLVHLIPLLHLMVVQQLLQCSCKSEGQAYALTHFEASYHSLCCLMIGQQPCDMHVPYVLWYAPGGYYKWPKKYRLYSISFVGARSLEVVGGCVVTTLGVQQLYRQIMVFHFGRWELAIYLFGRWILP